MNVPTADIKYGQIRAGRPWRIAQEVAQEEGADGGNRCALYQIRSGESERLHAPSSHGATT